MLIKQMNQENVSFVIIVILSLLVMVVMIWCKGQQIFRNIAIRHIKKTAYKIYFRHMSKHKAKKIMNRFDLIGKTRNIYYND